MDQIQSPYIAWFLWDVPLPFPRRAPPLSLKHLAMHTAWMAGHRPGPWRTPRCPEGWALGAWPGSCRGRSGPKLWAGGEVSGAESKSPSHRACSSPGCPVGEPGKPTHPSLSWYCPLPWVPPAIRPQPKWGRTEGAGTWPSQMCKGEGTWESCTHMAPWADLTELGAQDLSTKGSALGLCRRK